MMLLLRWMSRWPLGLIQGLGAGLGWLTWLVSPTYRRRLAHNATLAGLSPAQRRRSVAQAGRMFIEVPWLWFRDAGRPLGPLLRVEGAEMAQQAVDAGRGLVLLTPHLGTFEAAAISYAEQFGARQPITVLYRPARQPWLAQVQTTARDRPGMRAAPASLSGVRQLLRALRQGQTLGVLPDQVPPEGQGVWARFFDQPAYTMTLAARLVQQTGAALLLCWCERLPAGQGFVMHYRPMPAPLPSDEQAAAQAINHAMQGLIGECPEQYLWGYNRFKAPRGADPAPVEGAR
jgi:Kdo2-lipid IVA lauroyltransferase/acyltransferase